MAAIIQTILDAVYDSTNSLLKGRLQDSAGNNLDDGFGNINVKLNGRNVEELITDSLFVPADSAVNINNVELNCNRIGMGIIIDSSVDLTVDILPRSYNYNFLGAGTEVINVTSDSYGKGTYDVEMRQNRLTIVNSDTGTDINVNELSVTKFN